MFVFNLDIMTGNELINIHEPSETFQKEIIYTSTYFDENISLCDNKRKRKAERKTTPTGGFTFCV